ncbi:hypothetical protein QTP86_022215 [Hemibagrus guttatus]|nr:hypothetical protein QTP86_022215 [Hemibagrus guttatus]
MVVSVEEKIAVCDAILQDLLAVQRIIKEKGLCDAAFQKQKNQADVTI